MSKLYALLVGINAYGGPWTPLLGCLEDVGCFEEYLRRVTPAAELAVEVLRDHDATREQVQHVFRQHLGRAGAGDGAVFFYAGHGARWGSAPEFRPAFPEGMDEGLVCVDSNPSRGAYDLADKEMAVLIEEVARRDAHVAIVLDCCHSGSATRSIDHFTSDAARQADDARDPHEQKAKPRTLESYAGGHYAKQLARGDAGLEIPLGRHVLLAACDRTQQAFETRRPDGGRGGAFTHALLAALEQANSDVTYTDLFVRTRAAIRARGKEQTPQFESYRGFDARQGFLGRAVSRRGGRSMVFFDPKAAGGAGGWTVELGAIHGAPVDRPVELRLFAAGSSDQERGGARTLAVMPHSSLVALDFEPEANERKFEAEPTTLLAPPMTILFRGAADARTALAARLGLTGGELELTGEPAGVRFALETSEDGGTARLVERITGIEIGSWQLGAEAAAQELRDALASIRHWQSFLRLQNPRPRLDPETIEFWLELPEEGDQRYSESEGFPAGADRSALDPRTRELLVDSRQHVRRITRTSPAGRLAVDVVASNGASQDLHVALFTASALRAGMAEAFGVEACPSPEILAAGERHVWEMEVFLDPDQAHHVEHLVLVTSTEPLDSFRLAQRGIRLAGDGTRGSRLRSMVAPRISDDWFTKTLEITLAREAGTLGSGHDAELAGGAVVVKAHPSVTASISLAPDRADDRSGAVCSTLRALLEGGGAEGDDASPRFQMLALGPDRSRGSRNGTVLELTGLQGTEALALHPLEIEVEAELAEDERVVPLCFDGERVLPCGEAARLNDRVTRITLHRLPELPDDGRATGARIEMSLFKTRLDTGLDSPAGVEELLRQIVRTPASTAPGRAPGAGSQ